MLEECMVFLLSKAHQRVYQMSKAELQPYGITPVQYALLHLLWEKDGQSGAELGEGMRLDSATMTGLLDRLAHHEWIKRCPDPKDRRVNRIFVTEQGRALQHELTQVMDKINTTVLEDFTAKEAQLLKDMLIRLAAREEK